MQIRSWRCDGVPFFIRAGKCLPVTCTEVLIRLRKPPEIIPGANLAGNYLRIRISLDVSVALGMMVKAPGEDLRGEANEIIAVRHPHIGQMEAYERVLGDAMAGDATLFAREDYVEEAWRIVDPILRADTPVHNYRPGEWGAREVQATVLPPGGWHNPETEVASALERTTKAA